MSCIRLNIIDKTQTISGEVHGFLSEALIAALTAEPEDVEELVLALARFIKPESDLSPFASFREYENLEPHDAGILIIDLAARVVAVDSSYSCPSAKGSVRVQAEFADEDEDVILPYSLSDDWLFVYSIPEYEGVCDSRREEREKIKPFDAREVLYGKALLEFIVTECFAVREEFEKELNAVDASDEDAVVKAEWKIISEIHKKWLMSARDDLRGKTPRDVLFEKRKFVDFDLHSRELQWSFTKTCPPPLLPNSNAYKCAGFGIHEWVLYYDLVRYLLGVCFEKMREGISMSENSKFEIQNPKDISEGKDSKFEIQNSKDISVESLEKLKAAWFEVSDNGSFGKSPSHIIEWERKRVPLAMSQKDMLIDDDCPICVAMAEDFDTPGFWHLDGCNMDDGFEFSYCKTLEEYEEEERSREEFNRQFEEDRKAGKYNKPFDYSLVDFDDDDEGLPF